MGWRIRWWNRGASHDCALMGDRVVLWTDESKAVSLEAPPNGWEWATLTHGDRGQAKVVWHHRPEGVALIRANEVLEEGGRASKSWMVKAGDRLRFAEDDVEIEIVATTATSGGQVEFVERPAEGSVEGEAERMWALYRELARGEGWSRLLEALREQSSQLPAIRDVDAVGALIWEGEDEFYHRVIWPDDHDGGRPADDGPRRPAALSSLLTRNRAFLQALKDDRQAVCRTFGDDRVDVLLPIATSDGQFAGVFYLEAEVDEAFEPEQLWPVLLRLEPAADQLIRRYHEETIRRNYEEENRYFRERERRHYLFKDLICESEAMRRVYDELHERVDEDTPILMTGQAGTGKELLARALHHLGDRQEAMLIRMDCARFPPDLVGLELFGCVASELTGAVAARKGIFELAQGGTVFLDEIDGLSPMIQGKLVRLLEEREVRRIGDAVGRAVDARLIASTHRDLEKLCEQGRFRRDLYEAIRPHRMEVPSLRQRRDDIVPLARVFLKKFADRYDARCRAFSDRVRQWLLSYHWPGNVRQLQTVIEAAVLMAPDREVIEEAFNPHPHGSPVSKEYR